MLFRSLAPVTEDQIREWELDSIEDTIGMLGSDYVSNYIDSDKAENWFREAYAEMDVSYAEDIKSEDSSEGYANRLVDEMVDRNIVSDEKAKEDGFDGDEFQAEFVEAMVDEKINEGNGGYDYYVSNFGEEEANNIVAQNSLVDEEALVDEMVRSKLDGMSGNFDWEFSGTEEYYLEMISAGQDQFDSIKKPLIKKTEFDVLKKAWKTLHLRNFDDFSEAETKLMESAIKIYESYLSKKQKHLEKAIQFFMLKGQKGDKYKKFFNKILKKKGYKMEGVIQGLGEGTMISGYGGIQESDTAFGTIRKIGKYHVGEAHSDGEHIDVDEQIGIGFYNEKENGESFDSDENVADMKKLDKAWEAMTKKIEKTAIDGKTEDGRKYNIHCMYDGSGIEYWLRDDNFNFSFTCSFEIGRAHV